MPDELRQLSFKLLKSCCVVCGYRSAQLIDLCPACRRDLPWNTQCCGVCGLPLTSFQFTCQQCRLQRSNITRTVSPLIYQYPVNRLLTHFKNHRHLASGAVLGTLLAEALQPLLPTFSRKPQVIPVPLHLGRRLKRGFNQSRILAQIITHQCELELADVLTRNRRGQEQKHLSATERRRQMTGLFSCRAPISQVVILVDDVITTGATGRACADVLLAAGADEVVLAAPARTGVV